MSQRSESCGSRDRQRPGALGSGAEPPGDLDRSPVDARLGVLASGAQTAVEVAYVVGRGLLRVGPSRCAGSSIAVRSGELRCRRGSVLALMAYEVMAVVAAIGGDGALVIRGALAAGAIIVMVLLMVAISAFPSPDLPKIT